MDWFFDDQPKRPPSTSEKAFTAASRGDLETLEVHVSNGADVNEVVNGFTSLHSAASRGHAPVVEYLCTLPSTNLDARTEDGRHAVHIAAGGGHLPVIEAICHASTTDKDILKVTTGRQETTLHAAAYGGHINVVEYLVDVKGLDIEATTCDGMTPLQLASVAGQVEVVKFLASRKSKTTGCTSSGQTALHKAAFTGDLGVVRFLVELSQQNRAKTQGQAQEKEQEQEQEQEKEQEREQEQEQEQEEECATTPDGMSALHFAAMAGRTDVARYLLTHTRLRAAARAKSGQTALHKAAFGDHVEVLELLLQPPPRLLVEGSGGDDLSGRDHGADAVVGEEQIAGLVDGEGRSALHVAAAGGASRACELLQQQTCADASLLDATGRDAAEYAFESGYKELGRTLTRRAYVQLSARALAGTPELCDLDLSCLLEQGAGNGGGGDLSCGDGAGAPSMLPPVPPPSKSQQPLEVVPAF